jgi:hypothetical protein
MTVVPSPSHPVRFFLVALAPLVLHHELNNASNKGTRGAYKARAAFRRFLSVNSCG